MCLIMTFWQENHTFINNVQNTRANILEILMSKTNKAIDEVVVEKIMPLCLPYLPEIVKVLNTLFSYANKIFCIYASALIYKTENIL